MTTDEELRKIEEEVARRRDEERKQLEAELRQKFEAEAKLKADAEERERKAADEKAAFEQQIKDMQEKQKQLEEKLLAGQTTKRGLGAPLQSPFNEKPPVSGVDMSKVNPDDVEKASEQKFWEATRR